MINSDELIGATEYVIVYAKSRVNRFRCNRFPLYFH